MDVEGMATILARGGAGFLERRFRLAAHGTGVRAEVLAELTTFLTVRGRGRTFAAA
jgi:AGZA family xanthine/uracil permease-like MFS transporter